MIAGERAFVFAVGLNSFWVPDQQTGLFSWQLRPQWQNSGDTPTKGVTTHTGGAIRDTPLPNNFNFAYDTTEVASGGLLPPKITMLGGLFPRNALITPAEIADIQAGRKFLYIWGWARYSDVFFPNTPVHITRFCWQVMPVGDPYKFRPKSQEPFEELLFNYILHKEGNSADEETHA